MKNQIYRTELTDKYTLEFYVCDTNELNPHREIKELGIVVLSDGVQLDGSFDMIELDSLISYLRDCKDYIEAFNENSKLTEDINPPKTELTNNK